MKRARNVMAAAVVACLAMTASAVEVHVNTTWTAGDANNWGDPNNWSDANAPGAQFGEPLTHRHGYFGVFPGDVCDAAGGHSAFRSHSPSFNFYLLGGLWNPANSLDLQSATVYQTGGTWRSTGTVRMSVESAGTGSFYHLTDGNVEFGNLYMGDGILGPEFHQDGGTVTVAGDVLVNAGTNDWIWSFYEMTDGTLHVGGDLRLGYPGGEWRSGYFDIYAGDVTLGSLTINDYGWLDFKPGSTGVIRIDGNVVAEMRAYIDAVVLPGVTKIMGDPNVWLIGGHTWLSLAPPFELGDVNGDGNADNLDITPFIAALTAVDEAAFLTRYPDGFYWAADVNGTDYLGDGNVDNLDITAFVNIIAGGGEAVPEPITIGLLAVGGVAVLLRRRRRMS